MAFIMLLRCQGPPTQLLPVNAHNRFTHRPRHVEVHMPSAISGRREGPVAQIAIVYMIAQLRRYFVGSADPSGALGKRELKVVSVTGCATLCIDAPGVGAGVFKAP